MSENDAEYRWFMRRSEAAKYVANRYGFPCSRQWLAKLAVIGGGPAFRKAGRYPIYETGELDQWAQSRIGPPQRSTTEIGSARVAKRGGKQMNAPSRQNSVPVGLVLPRSEDGRNE
jgi:hypothetical protein